MKIAYTMAPGHGDTNLLLQGLATALQADGYTCRGTVQINSERDDCDPCDMDVQVLPDGPLIRISQSLGSGSNGCRLNPDALESAVGLVAATLSEDVDFLIVNKFGKQESLGRGFRPIIAEALARDIPVLVGLNALNAPAFHEFSAGLAQELSPDADVLHGWAWLALRADLSPANTS